MALQSAAHDRQHQGIADQLATGHHRLRLLAQGAAGLHLGPQQVTGGEMQQLPAFGQQRGLGALAGTGGAEEEESLLHGEWWEGGRGRGHGAATAARGLRSAGR